MKSAPALPLLQEVGACPVRTVASLFLLAQWWMLCINLACDRLDAAASPRPRALADTRTQPPGLNRLRNSGKRSDGAQGDPSNHNFTDHEYPPVLQRTPRFWPTMQFFRQIAQQIPPRANAPHPPSAFRVVSICEPFRLICRLMAMF